MTLCQHPSCIKGKMLDTHEKRILDAYLHLKYLIFDLFSALTVFVSHPSELAMPGI